MIPLWAKALIAAALVAVVVVGVNRYNAHQQNIGYQRAVSEYKAEEAKALKAALDETARLNDKVTEAQNNASKREKENQNLSVRIAALDDRLRQRDAVFIGKLSSATSEAVRNAASAYAALFAECRGRYAEMGRAAAGHFSDVVKLEEDWPKAE